MKKLFCIMLAAAMMLSLCSCFGSSEKGEKGDKDGVRVLYMGDDDYDIKKEFEGFEDVLDPEKVYSSIEYDEKMLYGRFNLNDPDKDFDGFVEGSQFEDVEYADNYLGESVLKTVSLSEFPCEIYAGPSAVGDVARVDRTHEWAELDFATENGGETSVLCTYTVSGNEVTYYPLDSYQHIYDEDFKLLGIKYETGEDGITYNFKMDGTGITLSKGDRSVKLESFYFSDYTNQFSFGGYLADGAPAFENLDAISTSYSSDYSSVYLTDMEDELNFYSFVKLSTDGLVTFKIAHEDEEGNITYTFKQMVYFPGDGYSTVLTDGEKVYYYTESSISREVLRLGAGMSIEEQTALQELPEDDINKLAEKKENLFADLATAFEDAGISVDINERTGEIAMDASVLFGGDSAEITEEGKAFLNKFIGAYTSIVYNEKYEGFVAKTVVEGHTAPVAGSTYESGLPLSVERAEKVKEYCLSSESGISGEYITDLSDRMESVGYSNTKPVLDADGNVDMDASRRVSFRFIVNLNMTETEE